MPGDLETAQINVVDSISNGGHNGLPLSALVMDVCGYEKRLTNRSYKIDMLGVEILII